MKNTITIVVKSKITVEYDGKLSAADVVEEVVENMDYSFEYNEDGKRIIKSEIIEEKAEFHAPRFVHWNTLRHYTPEGQHIVAMFDGHWIYFADLDRRIYGKYEHPTSEFNTATIMHAYDKGWYVNCAIPEELKAEIKRIGWGNKL